MGFQLRREPLGGGKVGLAAAELGDGIDGVDGGGQEQGLDAVGDEGPADVLGFWAGALDQRDDSLALS